MLTPSMEESASRIVLMDDNIQGQYDLQRKALRIEQRAMVVGMINVVTMASIRHEISRVVWVFKNLLQGAFAADAHV